MLFQPAKTRMVSGSDTPKHRRERSVETVHCYINRESGSQGSAIYYLTSAPFAAQAAGRQTTDNRYRTLTADGVPWITHFVVFPS